MQTLIDYANHDAVALADLVRRGDASASELVEHALAAMDALDGELNAVVNVMADEARAAVAAPLPEGPFTGVPFLLKDLVVSYAGVPTSSGSRLLDGWTRDYDSEILVRWKRAGLVVIGKTNTPELGSNGSTEPVAYGASCNPWNLGHSTGGSSGGSAAAVAAGIVPAAHASDGGGSIRGPASNCGVVGLKPTRGRNPLGPDAGEMWNGLVAEHVVSRTVRDTALILDCTAGADVGDPYVAPPPARPFIEEVGVDPGRLRVGFSPGTPPGKVARPESIAAMEGAATLLEGLGHEVEPAEPGYDRERLLEIFMTLFAAHSAPTIEALAAAVGRTPGPDNLERNNLYLMERGRSLSASDLLRALYDINGITRAFARFFEDYDIWLTPTTATPPPPLGHLDANMADSEVFFDRLWTYNTAQSIYNVSGHPAISVPLHWTDDGLPIGIQLGARSGGEDVLLRLASQLEQAQPWVGRHPPVSVWNRS